MVGPNGGGKTTLLRLILGLLTPTRGTVRVFGQPPALVRRRIGYMPQHAQLDPQFPVRALDVVMMSCLRPGRFGPFGRADKRRALAALDEVGLTDLARRPFAALSGGQRQRVLIARALACEPELLLLDEPTANLDPRARRQLLSLLPTLPQTQLIATHDLEAVAELCPRVLLLDRGQIFADGPAEEILRDAALLEAHGLEVPVSWRN
jgi:zinc transport system ATP-binding protein